MGWVKIYDSGGRLVEHLGDPDPLDERVITPKNGYWQDPDDRKQLSTAEDEAGL